MAGRVITAGHRFKGKDGDASLVLARVQASKQACMRMHEGWMYNIAFVRGGASQWAYRDSASGRVQHIPAVPWRSRIVDNQTRPLLEHMLALLIERRPTWTALARSSEEEDLLAGRGYEALLSYDWDRMELTDTLAEVLGWVLRAGNGILRVGWNPYAGAPVGVPIQEGKGIMAGKNQPAPEPKEMGAKPAPPEGDDDFFVPGEDEMVAGEAEPREPTDFAAIVYEGDVDVRCVSPFNFGVDIQADRLSRAGHVWQEAFVHRDVLVDIVGSKAKRIVPDVTIDEFRNYERRLRFDHGYDESFAADGEDEMVRVVECYEAPTRRTPKGRVLTVAGGETLSTPRENPYGGRFPFVHFKCYPVQGSFWADGPVDDLVPLQQSHNQALSRYNDIMKLCANPKMIADKGAGLKETAGNDRPGEIILKKQGTEVSFVSPPLPPPIHVQIMTLAQNSMQTITGVNDPLAGQNPPNVRSMGALSQLQAAGMRRFTPLALSIELALRQAGKLLLYMHQRYYTEDRTFQVVGRDGRAEVFHMANADVARIVDVTITHGSLLPKLPGAQQEAAMQIIQYAPFLFAGEDGKIDAEHIFGLLDMPTAQGGVSLNKRQRARAFRENVDAEKGLPIHVLPFDDDVLHMRIVAARLSDDEWVMAHAEAANVLMAHYAEHEAQKQQKLMGLVMDIHAGSGGPPTGMQTGSRPDGKKPGEGGGPSLPPGMGGASSGADQGGAPPPGGPGGGP